jgi:hypothetical protein
VNGSALELKHVCNPVREFVNDTSNYAYVAKTERIEEGFEEGAP